MCVSRSVQAQSCPYRRRWSRAWSPSQGQDDPRLPPGVTRPRRLSRTSSCETGAVPVNDAWDQTSDKVLTRRGFRAAVVLTAAVYGLAWSSFGLLLSARGLHRAWPSSRDSWLERHALVDALRRSACGSCRDRPAPRGTSRPAAHPSLGPTRGSCRRPARRRRTCLGDLLAVRFAHREAGKRAADC